MTKTCIKCGELKPLSHFHKKKDSKNGHMSACKVCKAEYNQKYYQENAEVIKESRRKYRQENAEVMRERDRKYRQENPEVIRERQQKWYQKNAEVGKEYRRKYDKENPEKVSALNAKRRAAKRQAVPSWHEQDKERIKELYQKRLNKTRKTGIEHHVDHIIPLRHKKVCGLHCADNLQLRRAVNNLKKNNYFSQRKESVRQLEIAQNLM